MKEFLLNLWEKTWLKPKSILISLFALSAFYVALISTIGEWDGVTLNATAYCVVAIPFVLTWLAYSIACICTYRLKRAPKDCLAVLFCIDAESPKLFAAAENKLVSNFVASLGAIQASKLRPFVYPKAGSHGTT